MEHKHHTWLWLFAFVAFVVGDSVTTAVGLGASAAESNPVAAAVLAEWGRVGMVLLKAGVVIGLYGFYYFFDRLHPYNVDDEVALLIGGLGLVITVWNAYVIVAG